MPQIRDEVRDARYAKALEWVATNNQWTADELVFGTAIGYFVPEAFKSKTKTNLNDERVIELMKAQGYKPRGPKASSDNDEEEGQGEGQAQGQQENADGNGQDQGQPIRAPNGKRKYTKRAKPESASLDELKSAIDTMSSALKALVTKVHEMQTAAAATAAANAPQKRRGRPPKAAAVAIAE
jgi:hypothetical protein